MILVLQKCFNPGLIKDVTVWANSNMRRTKSNVIYQRKTENRQMWGKSSNWREMNTQNVTCEGEVSFHVSNALNTQKIAKNGPWRISPDFNFADFNFNGNGPGTSQLAVPKNSPRFRNEKLRIAWRNIETSTFHINFIQIIKWIDGNEG